MVFHIIFSGDEKYVKYISVCLTSIVLNTDRNRSFFDFIPDVNSQAEYSVALGLDSSLSVPESYIFHILSNHLTAETVNKLSQLETELNKIFPTKIIIHILSDDVFHGQPKWRGSYLAYYRIMLDQFLPPEVFRTVYLDGDTLVNMDIRELFAMDLQNKTCAAVPNNNLIAYDLKGRFGKANFTFQPDKLYFNSGVMILDVSKWRTHGLEKKIMTFLMDYLTIAPDQDALNAIIGDSVLRLEFKYNVMVHKHFAMEDYMCAGENGAMTLYAREEFEQGLKQPKIIHFALKPWESEGKILVRFYKILHYPFFDLWWNMAKQVPVFAEELLAIKNDNFYLSKVAKEQKLVDAFVKKNFSFTKLLYILKLESRPYIKKIESHFKVIRNFFRAKKIKHQFKG